MSRVKGNWTGDATATPAVHGLLREIDTNGDGTPEDYFYLADDMHNVVGLADASGNLVETYEYGDFGQPSALGSTRTTSPPSRASAGTRS